ncbi:MAG: ATP-binding protein [Desulfobacterales bacterium]|nr:ATP-binding protein [Desulfobacterales bacterium]
MSVIDESFTIKASPTKELFIYMMTRDIPLIRAILDLVDNSVDGATRLQPGGDYSTFWVRIECTEEHFAISDNCGGIPISTARDYAFRFGRPKDMELTPGSIGKFGVGMKRSFFKLGNKFTVKSTTSTSKFVVEHYVREWLEKPEDWHFKFKVKNESLKNVPEQKIGTQILIEELFESVSKSFGLGNFRKELCDEIETAHAVVMAKGLAISFNGRPLGKRTLSLYKSDQLKPAFIEKRYENIGPAVVKVQIYAGISDRDFEKGGWYIFCNGRMVLEADQTDITTWGGSNTTPKYHPDFAFFRGYVFFDSEDAELLPWTTTKTGIDSDSGLYKNVKLEMITLMRPVLDFLRKLAKERADVEKGDIDKSLLEESVKKAESTNYLDLKDKGAFITPKFDPIPRGPRTGRIQYNKPVDDIKKLKKILGVTTYTAVGEKTFDYFMRMECEE